MAQRPIRKLEVADKRVLTPNMLRLTLTGDALSDFPPQCAGDYVKLVLPTQGEDVAGAEVGELDLRTFVRRSFTVREVDVAARLLVLDVVRQGHGGPASDWVAGAQPGDRVLVHGPGPVKSLDASADWVFLAADMAALPALAVQLERLPSDARGIAVIEVLSPDDRQLIEAPRGVETRWVVNAEASSSRLPDEVRAQPWAPGRVSVWAACEFGAMKRLRSYFFEERGVSPGDTYISSYWKVGATDEQHKAAKRLEG